MKASAIALKEEKKKRLLIVDDEQDITFVLDMMLSEYYDVAAFTNPVEALGSVKPGRYDLILFDYLMPEMNGYDFYRGVRKIDSAVRMCMMTRTRRSRPTIRATSRCSRLIQSLC